MADERDEKQEGEETGDQAAAGAAEPARETAVGHQVVEADATEEADTGATEVFFSKDDPVAETQPAAAPPQQPSGTSPAAADRQAAEAQDEFAAKPELFVAGAFVGAFIIGKLLKKLTGSDD
jgi:hypothetical protein